VNNSQAPARKLKTKQLKIHQSSREPNESRAGTLLAQAQAVYFFFDLMLANVFSYFKFCTSRRVIIINATYLSQSVKLTFVNADSHKSATERRMA
jgi:hypothetical protein